MWQLVPLLDHCTLYTTRPLLDHCTAIVFVVLHVFLVPIISSHDKLWGLARRVFTLFRPHMHYMQKGTKNRKTLSFCCESLPYSGQRRPQPRKFWQRQQLVPCLPAWPAAATSSARETLSTLVNHNLWNLGSYLLGEICKSGTWTKLSSGTGIHLWASVPFCC